MIFFSNFGCLSGNKNSEKTTKFLIHPKRVQNMKNVFIEGIYVYIRKNTHFEYKLLQRPLKHVLLFFFTGECG